MGCQSKVSLGDNLVFSICTHDPDTGVLTDTDSLPTFRVYKEEGATPIAGGNMVKFDDANTTGLYIAQIACTQRNDFQVGKTITIYIEATVDSATGGICFACNVKQGPWKNAIIEGINTEDNQFHRIIGRIRER